MAIKVGINGFGRIGRLVGRICLETEGVDLVAVNDLSDAKGLAHLFKYDSIHGALPQEVCGKEGMIACGNKEIKVLSERDPANLPWGDLGVDVVLESTGLFRDSDTAGKHIKAGAKKVIISAPPKGDIPTFVIGVNCAKYDKTKDHIVSNASCTTNCLAPVAKVVNDNFVVKHGLMTTIHSYTNDQRILDLIHSDLRRARAAAMNMIPTTTGAARAVGKVLPELNGKLDGLAIRVPTPNVSLVDVVFQVEKSTSADEVNAKLREAANGPMKGVLQVIDEELVSGDFNHCSASSSVDAPCTSVMEGNMVKVMSWYDNEWGFSCRVVDLMLKML